jgi:hypothetical protein
MLNDTMDDHITVEQILLQQAREIAMQSSRHNSAETDLAPWGGVFSKDHPQEIHAAQQVGTS